MIKALNNGDWSQVIDGQTQEATAGSDGGKAKVGGTNGANGANGAGALVGPDVASPFTQDSVTRSVAKAVERREGEEEEGGRGEGVGDGRWAMG